jgi:hypothetical protein
MGDIELLVGLRMQPGHLGLKARDLLEQRAHVGGGEGGIEPRQHVSLMHPLPLMHIDRPHDRGIERLQHDGGRFGNQLALRRHHLVDRDQPGGDHEGHHGGGDQPDHAACRAGERRCDQRRRGRGEFQQILRRRRRLGDRDIEAIVLHFHRSAHRMPLTPLNRPAQSPCSIALRQRRPENRRALPLAFHVAVLLQP